MISPTEIQNLIQNAIPGAEVYVDEVGGGDHFQVVVVAEQFDGVLTVERHRMVYAPLKGLIGGAVHALGLKTYTPTQWKNRPQEPTGLKFI